VRLFGRSREGCIVIRFLKPKSGRNPAERLKQEIADTGMVRLLESWLGLAGNSELPDKAGFDPLDHPALLPRMWIYELTPDRRDFIGRLCGEEIRHVWGQTTKGMALSRISSPELFRTNHRRWLYCVTAPAVLLGRSTGRDRSAVMRLSLPFTDPEGRLYVLGASRYDFEQVDPFDERPPFRHSGDALAVRLADLAARARQPEDADQAAISSRTWAAQASPRA
jgi:hypothetical protein